jgi:outer membrane protein
MSISVLRNTNICILFFLSLTISVHASEKLDYEVEKVTSINTMQVEESSPWEFGIAVGTGERDNILVDTSNISINAFVHIAYFGEDFFFDNGDFGYYLTDNHQWNINLTLGPNSERQFFESFNRLGIDLTATSDNEGTTGNVIGESADTRVRPTNRDKPIDFGFELIGDGDWGSLQLQLNTDVKNEHNGYELWGGYNYNFKFGKLRVIPSFGFIYKSDKWTNYFYGVKQNEAVLLPNESGYIRAPYIADSASNSFYKLSLNYALSEKLKAIAVFESEYLHNEIKASPIVNKDNIDTQFIGLFYEF